MCMKNCRVCGIELTDDNWYFSSKKIQSNICIRCVLEKDFNNYHKGELIKYSDRRIIINKTENIVKYCNICRNELNNNNWSKSNQNDTKYICKECQRIYLKRYYRENYITQTNELGKQTLIKCKKRKRPNNICEICNEFDGKKLLFYHHWDNENPHWGMWVCRHCHITIEQIEKIPTITNIYLNLKQKIESGEQ